MSTAASSFKLVHSKPSVSSVLDERSVYLRRLIIDAIVKAGRGHLGSAMSLLEILRVLYDDILCYRSDDPAWQERDRFILSKGHGCLALYVLLADKGFFPVSELDRFCSSDGMLGGHPEFAKVPGVEASTGSLGHGLSIGIGMALAAKLKYRSSRIFVVLGDGETNEGAVWEAAMTAAKHKLDNLTAIIDYNKMQSYGSTYEVLDMEPLVDKWTSFGFAVCEVDGHDILALKNAFTRLPLNTDRPSVVICHTLKGKGIPDAESNPDWHHKNRLSLDELKMINQGLGIRG